MKIKIMNATLNQIVVAAIISELSEKKFECNMKIFQDTLEINAKRTYSNKIIFYISENPLTIELLTENFISREIKKFVNFVCSLNILIDPWPSSFDLSDREMSDIMDTITKHLKNK
jgi:hypothetical protein